MEALNFTINLLKQTYAFFIEGRGFLSGGGGVRVFLVVDGTYGTCDHLSV